MLDLFVIFSKGGIVLWMFQGAEQLFNSSVNALVKSVILQEKSGNSVFQHDKLALKYKLDNEFELIYVVAYQSQLQLSYVDKFLTSIQLEFRDKYKNDLIMSNFGREFDFKGVFMNVLRNAEEQSRIDASVPKQMKTFEESEKSKKKVASMIKSRKDLDAERAAAAAKLTKGAKGKENKKPSQQASKQTSADELTGESSDSNADGSIEVQTNGLSMAQKREEFFKKKIGGSKKSVTTKPEQPKKKVKEARQWDLGGSSKDAASLDVFNTAATSDQVNINATELECKGQMSGNLKDIETDSESEDEIVEEMNDTTGDVKNKSSGYGFFSMFKSLAVTKTLTKESVSPLLDKMKDHLIAKNVASDIAEKLCDSVSSKLEGKVLGTFSGVASTVKKTLQESCVQILSPQRRIDILRDAMDAKQRGQPYCITFCGVNGVGKSTNLSKVAFWLIENGLTVSIAACDTFRAGAVEQLRTHTRKLNAIHPPSDHGGRTMVDLYEKGYDKDAASIAMAAIGAARDKKIDVVLIDTAGRMQDNEPLMKSLAKLIKVNQPDLVLFVGEALVGNEAVDQLVKFNQALADHSQQEKPHLIDGIVLTKFDTIDDKVGAAVSMTYITGQPIVFVGTGQTYTDLKTLNAKAVVTALMKG